MDIVGLDLVIYCLERVPAVVAKKPELKNVEPFKTVLSGNREAIAKLPTRVPGPALSPPPLRASSMFLVARGLSSTHPTFIPRAACQPFSTNSSVETGKSAGSAQPNRSQDSRGPPTS